METHRVEPLAKLKKCMAGYDADLTLYTTTIAMDDLDDVRAFLGYDQINIYGGSYGTRAGLVYMRQHGDHVRAAVLDGVAPTNMRLPLFFPRDSCSAPSTCWSKDCDATTAAARRIPTSATRLPGADGAAREDAADGRRHAPAHRRARRHHASTPRLVANILVIDALLADRLVAGAGARSSAPSRTTSRACSRWPRSATPAAEPNMSVGMQLSVICAEDAPRITPEEVSEGIRRDAVRPVRDAHAAGRLRVLAARRGRRRVLRAGHLSRPDAGDVRRARSGHAAGVGRGDRQAPPRVEAHRDARHRPHRRRHRLRPAHHPRLHRRKGDHRRPRHQLRGQREAAAVLPHAGRPGSDLRRGHGAEGSSK